MTRHRRQRQLYVRDIKGADLRVALQVATTWFNEGRVVTWNDRTGRRHQGPLQHGCLDFLRVLIERQRGNQLPRQVISYGIQSVKTPGYPSRQKPGVAQLAQRSRTHMIRCALQLLGAGILAAEVGGGTFVANSYWNGPEVSPQLVEELENRSQPAPPRITPAAVRGDGPQLLADAIAQLARPPRPPT